MSGVIDSMEGTVIHGTHRPQDLIPRFMEVLLTLSVEQYLEIVLELGKSECPIGIAVVASGYVQGIDATDDHPWWNSDDAAYLLNETLFDRLNGLAGEGFYFGSHPGNGSDFGFWQHEEYIEHVREEGIKAGIRTPWNAKEG